MSSLHKPPSHTSGHNHKSKYGVNDDGGDDFDDFDDGHCVKMISADLPKPGSHIQRALES